MHPTLNRLLSAIGLVLILAASSAPAQANAQRVHALVREALVVVRVTAQNVHGDPVGPAVATGFFVDPFGTVVTSKHIIRKLSKGRDGDRVEIVEDSIEWTVIYSPKGGEDSVSYKAFGAPNQLPDIDAIALDLRKNGTRGNFPFLSRDTKAELKMLDVGMDLYTSGFVHGEVYEGHESTVTRISPVAGAEGLWVSEFKFEEGQSGSPIYSENGSLVGLVKGADREREDRGYFVPIIKLALVAYVYDREAAVDDAPKRRTDFVHVVRETESASVEPVRASLPFRAANSHCGDERKQEWTIDANPGSTVEIDSVVVNKRLGASALLNVGKPSETQIKATGLIRNYGACTAGSLDVPGALDFQIYFTELTPVERNEQTIAKFELGKEVKLPLAPGDSTSDIKVYVEGAGVRSPSLALGESASFLKQEFNARTNQLTIEKKGQTGFSAASWSSPNSNNNNNRYSQLDQINTKTVGSLRPAWTFSAGALRGNDVMPLVVGNMMYVQTLFPNIVYALDLDAESRIVWTYEPKHDPDATPVVCCDPVNYGVQYADGKIVLHQADTTLITLDAKTGKELWTVVNGDPKRGQSGTGAALIVGGTVIVGIAGSEFGVRGHVTGYDLETGRRKWRAHAVGPDEDILFDPEKTTSLGKPVGKDSSLKTWTGDQWKLTGGSAHGWYAYDPNLNLFYYATGNPSTWNPGQRAGPNSEPFDQKWTQSILARNPDTGIAAWAYQMTPFDAWDHDAVGELILADDMTVGGKKHDALAHFDRSGSLLVLDRKTGLPLVAEAYDSANGGPGSSAPGDAGTSAEACPARAKDQQRSAYSPLTGLFFVVPSDSVCMDYEPFKVEDSKPSSAETPEKRAGNLIAWNAATGKIVWGSREQVQSAIIATAGGILCFGTSDGYFKCLDQKDGAELYKLRVPSGLVGNIMTYSHRDKQYIGVYSGVGGWAGIGPSEGDGPQPHEGARNDKGESDVPKNGKDRTADGYDGLKQYSELGGTLTLLSLPDGLLLRN